jgi:hypothetical protein
MRFSLTDSKHLFEVLAIMISFFMGLFWQCGSPGSFVGPHRAGAALLPHWPSIDRSGADDPDADHRLCVCHPLGAGLCREVQVNLAYRWFCGNGPINTAF